MTIRFNCAALINIQTANWSLLIGVYRDPNTVYKVKNGREVEVDCDWVWGRATEQYDHCLEYFGFGPLFLVCWPPSGRLRARGDN